MDERFRYVDSLLDLKAEADVDGLLGIVMTLVGGAWYGKVELAKKAAQEEEVVLAELEGIAEVADEDKPWAP